ncbi:hypothetical protein ACFWVM_04845 [Nocardia fluminea]|uniref:hypothetical protein n=1 Tax=Nocardia fluminea TaxID=134984 RepID=UPI003649C69C
MSGSTPSADRIWHAQAGDLLADDYNVPGIVMCAIGVVGLACIPPRRPGGALDT